MLPLFLQGNSNRSRETRKEIKDRIVTKEGELIKLALNESKLEKK
jgi:hypothetical protein